MIDDKKIEDVANEYSQDNCGYSYNINKFLAFKDGAKWMQEEFLKGLWHPVSEVPEIGRVIIIENHYPDGRIEFPSRMRKSTSHNPINGETQKWFYIDDLFVKKGDKHD